MKVCLSISYAIVSLIVFTGALGADVLPWIGVKLGRVDGEERAGTAVVEGAGLLVEEVSELSPLSAAGGKVGDLWWKFDGQILVNRRQILVLLKTKSVGDEVRVDFFRDGEKKNFTLRLAQHLDLDSALVSTDKVQGFKRAGKERSRYLAKREQVAKLRRDEHDFSLQSEGGRWRFEVERDDKMIFSSLIEEKEVSSTIPSKWVSDFMMLKLTLAQSEQVGAVDHPKRVRYIPRRQGSKE